MAVVGVILAGGEERARHLARFRVPPVVFVARRVVLAVLFRADPEPPLGAVLSVEAKPQGVAGFQRSLGLGGGFRTLSWLAFQGRSLRQRTHVYCEGSGCCVELCACARVRVGRVC